MNWFLVTIPITLVAFAIFFCEQIRYKSHETGIVLITGASTGIGRHAAEFLANNHKYTVLAGVRKESDAQDILNMNIANLKPLIVDVTKHDSCVAAIDNIKELMKETSLPFVALVNNAGVSSKMPVEFYDMKDARSLFDANVFGLIEMTQLSLPLLRQSQGRIIMISSVAGLIARSYSSMYTASKFAVEGFSDSLRREVAHMGISVSIVQPAFVKTPIFKTAADKKVVAVATLSEEQKSLYADFFSPSYQEKYDKIFEKADLPDVTTEVIVHAIASKSPKTRYLVANANGIPAKVVGWMEWLLDDRLMDRAMGSMV